MNRLPSIVLATIVTLCLGHTVKATALVGPDNLVLSVSQGCPGQVTISWQGADPDRTAALFFAGNLGRIVIPNTMCQGTELGLGTDRIQIVRTFRTGENGSGELLGTAPLVSCGGYLQMLVAHGAPCPTSNVVQIP